MDTTGIANDPFADAIAEHNVGNAYQRPDVAVQAQDQEQAPQQQPPPEQATAQAPTPTNGPATASAPAKPTAAAKPDATAPAALDRTPLENEMLYQDTLAKINQSKQQPQPQQETPNAIRQQGPAGVLSRQPKEAGEAGSERQGMGQVQQGQKDTGTSQKAEVAQPIPPPTAITPKTVRADEQVVPTKLRPVADKIISDVHQKLPPPDQFESIRQQANAVKSDNWRDSKVPIGTVNGKQVFAVNGDIINRMVHMDFVDGDNGAHNARNTDGKIPGLKPNEIIVDSQESAERMRHIIVHEAMEMHQMERGVPYDKAHPIANATERESMNTADAAKQQSTMDAVTGTTANAPDMMRLSEYPADTDALKKAALAKNVAQNGEIKAGEISETPLPENLTSEQKTQKAVADYVDYQKAEYQRKHELRTKLLKETNGDIGKAIAKFNAQEQIRDSENLNKWHEDEAERVRKEGVKPDPERLKFYANRPVEGTARDLVSTFADFFVNKLPNSALGVIGAVGHVSGMSPEMRDALSKQREILNEKSAAGLGQVAYSQKAANIGGIAGNVATMQGGLALALFPMLADAVSKADDTFSKIKSNGGGNGKATTYALAELATDIIPNFFAIKYGAKLPKSDVISSLSMEQKAQLMRKAWPQLVKEAAAWGIAGGSTAAGKSTIARLSGIDPNADIWEATGEGVLGGIGGTLPFLGLHAWHLRSAIEGTYKTAGESLGEGAKAIQTGVNSLAPEGANPKAGALFPEKSNQVTLPKQLQSGDYNESHVRIFVSSQSPSQNWKLDDVDRRGREREAVDKVRTENPTGSTHEQQVASIKHSDSFSTSKRFGTIASIAERNGVDAVPIRGEGGQASFMQGNEVFLSDNPNAIGDVIHEVGHVLESRGVPEITELVSAIDPKSAYYAKAFRHLEQNTDIIESYTENAAGELGLDPAKQWTPEEGNRVQDHVVKQIQSEIAMEYLTGRSIGDAIKPEARVLRAAALKRIMEGSESKESNASNNIQYSANDIPLDPFRVGDTEAGTVVPSETGKKVADVIAAKKLADRGVGEPVAGVPLAPDQGLVEAPQGVPMDIAPGPRPGEPEVSPEITNAQAAEPHPSGDRQSAKSEMSAQASQRMGFKVDEGRSVKYDPTAHGKKGKQQSAKIVSFVDQDTVRIKYRQNGKGDFVSREVPVASLSETGQSRAARLRAESLAELTPEERTDVKTRESEFNRIVSEHPAFADLSAMQAGEERDGMGGGMDISAEKRAARQRAAAKIGISVDDANNIDDPVVRARSLDALQNYVNGHGRIEEAQAQYHGQKTSVGPEDLEHGELIVTPDDKIYTVNSDGSGTVNIMDGNKVVEILAPGSKTKVVARVLPGADNYDALHEQYEEQGNRRMDEAGATTEQPATPTPNPTEEQLRANLTAAGLHPDAIDKAITAHNAAEKAQQPAQPSADTGSAKPPTPPPEQPAQTPAAPNTHRFRFEDIDKAIADMGMDETATEKGHSQPEFVHKAKQTLEQDPMAGTKLIDRLKVLDPNKRKINDDERGLLFLENAVRERETRETRDAMNALPTDHPASMKTVVDHEIAKEYAHESYRIVKESQSGAGLALSRSRVTTDDELNYVAQEDALKAELGRDPTKEEKAARAKHVDNVRADNKATEETKQKLDGLKLEAEGQRRIDDHLREMREQTAQAKEKKEFIHPDLLKEVRRIADKIRKAADASEADLIKEWKNFTSGQAKDLTQVAAESIVLPAKALKLFSQRGAQLLVDGVADIGEFTNRLEEKYGPDIRKFSKQIYDASHRAMLLSAGGKKDIVDAIPKAAKIKEPATVESILAEKPKEGEPSNFGSQIDKLARLHIENDGVTKVQPLLEMIQKDLQPSREGITKEQIQAEWSRYGKQGARPDPKETEKTFRDLKSQALVLSQLEDAVKNMKVDRTGKPRDPVSLEYRVLKQELYQKMKKAGITVGADAEQHLATVQDSIHKGLSNQLDELIRYFDTGERVEKTPGVEYNEENEKLRDFKNRVQNVIRDIEPAKEGATQTERINRAIEQTERLTEEARRMMREGVTERSPQEPVPVTPALQKARDAKAAAYAELKALADAQKPQTSKEAKLAMAKLLLAERAERNQGAKAEKKTEQAIPRTEETAPILDELYKTWQRIAERKTTQERQKKPTSEITPEMKRDQATIDRLEEKIAGQAKGRAPVEKPAQEHKELTPQEKALKDRIDELKSVSKAMKIISDETMSPEEKVLRMEIEKSKARQALIDQRRIDGNIERNKKTPKQRYDSDIYDSQVQDLQKQLDKQRAKEQHSRDALRGDQLINEMASRSGAQKTADWVVGLNRFNILSGLKAAIKLPAYVVNEIALKTYRVMIQSAFRNTEKSLRQGIYVTPASLLTYLASMPKAYRASKEMRSTGDTERKATIRRLREEQSGKITPDRDLEHDLNLRKYPQWMDRPQREHSAIKTFLWTMEDEWNQRVAHDFVLQIQKRDPNFTAAQVPLYDAAMKHGFDPNHPVLQNIINLQSVLAANGTILMDPGWISKGLKKATSGWEEPNKLTGKPDINQLAFSTAVKIATPVTTVPENMVKGVARRFGGLLYNGVQDLIAMNTKTKMNSEQAHYYNRRLVDGSLGVVIGTLIGTAVYNGYRPIVQGTWDDPTGKDHDGVLPEQTRFMGVKFPTIAFHNPTAETIVLMQNLADAFTEEKLPEEAYNTIVDLANESPVASLQIPNSNSYKNIHPGVVVGNIVGQHAIPQFANNIAQYMDPDTDDAGALWWANPSNDIEIQHRKSDKDASFWEQFYQALEKKIPGLRWQVPES